jgi:cell wall-associated NlpC family hydrolase
LPDTKGGQLTTLDVSGTNSLGMYLNLMMNIFIGICAVLAVIMILMGGIEYMSSELISSKEAGKERIRNALLGLLLALGAWTLLNTINPNLLNTSFSSLTSVAADAQLGGESSLPYVPIAQSALQSAGLTCPGGGGASALTSTAESFIGHSNYSNKARNTMTGSVANVDCSSFVDQVYTCSGLTPPGNTTADIFSTCTPATAATIQTGPSGTTVNGTALKVGDLLGWKAGQGGQSSGHVIMYVGNGNIIDSQQGVAVSQRPLDAKMMSMIQCVKPLGQ